MAFALSLTGCFSSAPKFSPDVQRSFRDYDMQRMDTDRLKIYYPEHRREEALIVATQMEECLEEIEASVPRPVRWWGSVPVYLPEVEFNNAYVAYGPATEPHIVMPTLFTANIFGPMGFTPSASAIGCHEMVHYVQFTQIHGFYGWINRVFGPSVNPQIGLDFWFLEGLATYLESQLVEGVGRYGSPIWEAYFAAGVAETRIDGGRMSQNNREIPYGAHYLVGSHFIAYLADTYGEELLWEVVDLQGRSVLFPFAVSTRFYRVYGRSLGGLVREFADVTQERYPPRQQSISQVEERYLGQSAALEVGPRGRQAIFYRDLDEIATIEVLDRDGQRIARRFLPDVLPGRKIAGGAFVDSLRFSPDGETLYFLVYHQGSISGRTSLMALDLRTSRVQVVRDELRATGMDLFPDGSGFLLAFADGAAVQFSRVGPQGDGLEPLFRLPRGAYAAWLRLSPSGDRLAVTLMENEEWSVAILEASTGRLLGKWTTGRSHHPVFDAAWIDEETLSFVGTIEGVPQVVTGSLRQGTASVATQVPYMAFNPRPMADGSLQLLNRRGWGWSLDRVAEPSAIATREVQWVPAAQGDEIESEWQVARIEGYGELIEPTQVHRDEPYAWHDGLFFPRSRTLNLGLIGAEFEVGASISGRDALGFHNWAIGGGYDSRTARPSFSLGYTNTQLAPWYIDLTARDQWLNLTETDPATMQVTRLGQQRDRVVELGAYRSFFGMPVLMLARGVEYARFDLDGTEPLTNRLVGPEIAAMYRAGRSTAYGGAQWLFGITGRGAYYAEELGSDFSLGDGFAGLELHSPLPLSRRHRLRFHGRFRGVTGVPDGEEVLRIGGFADRVGLFASPTPDDPEPVARDLTPPAFVFVEPLRGFETLGLAANQALLGELNYRYPLIIDRGAASVFGFLPSIFLHGIDLEGFASGATLLDGGYHAAVGASADLNFSIWLLPFSVRYQISQRLTDDLVLSQIVAFGLGGNF